MARRLNCHLELLHASALPSYVDHPAEQRARLGGTGPLALVGNPPDVQEILERDLKSRVTELLGSTDFQIRVEANRGRPDWALDGMARKAGTELVVIGSHQYQGFERVWNMSISRGLLRNTTMNVVVVPLATLRAKPAPIAPPVERVLVTTDLSVLAQEIYWRFFTRGMPSSFPRRSTTSEMKS